VSYLLSSPYGNAADSLIEAQMSGAQAITLLAPNDKFSRGLLDAVEFRALRYDTCGDFEMGLAGVTFEGTRKKRGRFALEVADQAIHSVCRDRFRRYAGGEEYAGDEDYY